MTTTQAELGDGRYITATASECVGANDPVTSGTPVVWGTVAGVATKNEDTTADKVVIDTRGVHELAVKGENGSGNAAIAVGGAVYIDTDGELNGDDTNGTFFGRALAAVSSGATTTIKVRVGY